MIIPLKRSPVSYTFRRAGSGWCIYELDEPIAFCNEETFARAICSALNTHRARVNGDLDILLIEPPHSHLLN